MGAFRSLMQIKLADEALKAIENLIRQDVQDFMGTLCLE